jgi:uncharacterized glyoxalase superfamily protein PhnB
MATFREAFPILTVDDVDRAVDFYSSTFGFEKTYGFGDEGRSEFAFLRLEPLGIGLARRSSPDDPDFAVWIYANDVDEAAERLRAAGAEEVMSPADQEWGERLCSFRDRDGHLIHVGGKR